MHRGSGHSYEVGNKDIDVFWPLSVTNKKRLFSSTRKQAGRLLLFWGQESPRHCPNISPVSFFFLLIFPGYFSEKEFSLSEAENSPRSTVPFRIGGPAFVPCQFR